MNRSRILISIAVCFVAGIAIAADTMSHVPKTNTRDAIAAYVQGAAKIVQKSGPSCETFASKEWRSGDYYIFVLGPDEKLLCHPNPDMVGKLQSEITNAKGDKVGEWILKAGTGEGKGWVDYLWARPGQTAEVPKSSYVMGVKGPDGKHYIVGAGGYDLKK
jgi:signal transduction histidine kinase